mgnify:FL=1
MRMKKYISLSSIVFMLAFVLMTGCNNPKGGDQPTDQDDRDSLILNEPQNDLLNQDQKQNDSADTEAKSDTAKF